MFWKKNKQSSIQHKLMKMGMVTSSITLLLTCTLFVGYGIVQTRGLVIKELSLISQVIGNRAGAAIDWGDKETVTKSLDDLKVKDSITMACVYDNKGEVFASYLTGSNNNCPASQVQGIHSIGWRQLALYNIISFHGMKVGTIYIRSDIRDITKEIPSYIGFAFMLLMVVGVIAYIISRHYQQLIAKPILQLAATTRRIIKQDYSIRAQKFDNDEVGLLVDSFNEMLSEVQKRDTELNEINDSLENKVKERTKDLEVSKARAEAANEAKSEFLRNMSHEFRTPLHGMRNFSTFGMDSSETAERSILRGYFQRIDMMTTRLVGLTEGILDVAQMESGTGVFTLAKHNIAETCSEVIAEQQAAIAKKGVHVILHEPEHPVEVIYDRNKIFQVLVNVLGNAIKFTPPGKNIVFDIEHNDKEFKVSVTDQGVGIPEAELEAIFKKFVQSTRTKTDAGGTGLGLSICKNIIRGHEGKIWAENNADGGATLSFTIPLTLEAGHKIVKANYAEEGNR
jgi:signal transduction histidine kinase